MTAIKKMLPILIICFTTGFLSTALGIINYKNNLLSAETNHMKQAGAYITQLADSIDDEEKEQYLLALVIVLDQQNNAFDAAIENCYIYDKNADILYSNDTSIDAENILNILKNQGFAETITGNAHYVPVNFDDNLTLILYSDTSEISEKIRNIIIDILIIFLVSFLILAAILILASMLVKQKKGLKTLTCILTFLWIFIICGFLALLSVIFIRDQVVEDRTAISNDIAEDVHNINAKNDEDMAVYAESIHKLVGDDFTDSLEKANGDLRLAAVYLNMSMYDDFSAYFSSVEALPSILDESLAIADRLVFNLDYQYLLNYGISYILQILMLSSCAVVLIMEIFYYEDNKIKSNLSEQNNKSSYISSNFSSPKKSNVRQGFTKMMSRYDQAFGDRLKLIFTFYRIASALISIVSVIMLKRWVLLDYPNAGSLIITIVIIVEGFIELTGQMLFYRIFLMLKNSIRFFQLSLLLVASGTIICYVSESAVIYIAGYFLIGFGTSIIFNTSSFHSEGAGTDVKTKAAMFRQINLGGRVGNLVGFVLGTAISTVVNDTTIFLIAFIVMLFTFLISLGYSGQNFNYTVPEKISYAEIAKSPNMVFYALLILLPSTFADYFMSYKVPLDIATFGLTVSLFSFLKYLRELIILLENYKCTFKKIFEKINPVMRATLMNIIAAGIIIIYCLFSRLYALIIAVILLALIRANFGTSIHFKILNLNSNDYGDSSRFNILNEESRSLGKSIASFLTESIGFLTLPILMIVTATGFFCKQKFNKRTAANKE